MSHRTHHPHMFIVLLAVVLLAGALMAAGAQAGGSSRDYIWLQQWTPPVTDWFTGGSVARSATGDVFVAGTVFRGATSHYDWTVARYASSGSRKWVRRLTTPTGDHTLRAVGADAHGNVVLVGQVKTPTHDRDLLVAKWSRGGTLLWKRQIDGTAHAADGATDVAVAADGSITVVGSVTNITTSVDCIIVKYSPSGRQLWRHDFNNPENNTDEFSAVALDANGNAYAAGHDYQTGRANDALLIRYNANGHRQWTRRMGDSVEPKHQWYSDVAVRGGYVAAAGVTMNDPDPLNWEQRGLVAKYTTAGTLKWAHPLANPVDPLKDAAWQCVGIDSSGRVAVAGYAVTNAALGEMDWLTTVYSATGVPGTVLSQHGSYPAGDHVQALLSTAAGTVYVTGSMGMTPGGENLYTLALSATGSPKWAGIVDDPSGANDVGGGLAATSTHLYVGASYYNSLALAKYAR
jgi:hypothetical protein